MILLALAIAGCHVEDDPAPPGAAEPDATVAWVAPRRLTIRQLRRAVGDLLGVDALDGVDLPADPRSDGFDDQADALVVSQLLVDELDEGVAAAAAAWVDRLRGPEVVTSEVEAWGAPFGCPMTGIGAEGEAFWVAWRDAPISTTFAVPAAGRYTLDVRMFHKLSLFMYAEPNAIVAVDGRPVGSWNIDGAYEPVEREVAVDLDAGQHTLSLAVSPGVTAQQEAESYTVHGFCVEANAIAWDHVVVRGPIDTAGMPCRDGEGCARQILAPLARRAWRSEPGPSLDRAAALVDAALDEGLGFDDGLALAMQAILLSPRFLLLPEPGGPRPLDGWELAARLGLTLWGTLPDDALLDCAATGELTSLDGPCGLGAQVDRMLADPRLDALLDDFGAVWLRTAELDAADLDAADAEALAADLRGETEAVLAEVLRDDLPMTTLVDADFTWLNARLAAWYGVAGVTGDALQRAPAPPGRAGVLGHGAVLAVTSEPWRTSPVRRGVYVLDNLVCEPPDPPPAGVPPLDVAPGVSAGDALDALDAHRHRPGCAECHAAIDPLGLALERWGPGGQERADPPEVDAVATDGTPLRGPDDLVRWLLAHPGLERCLTSRLATWALARQVDPDERRVDAWLAEDGSLRATLRAIVLSPSFRERGAAP